MKRFLPLLLLLGACGDDAVSADDFISKYPDAYCAFLWRCCDSNERSYSSTATCANAVRDQVNELLAFRDDGSARAEYLEAGAKGCLDKLESGFCTDTTLKGGCLDDVTRAGAKTGDQCRYSAECASFYCVQQQKNTLGLCGERSVIGGSCSGDDRGCPLGSYCSAYRKCETQKGSGSSCSRPEMCESGVCSASGKYCSGKGTTQLCDGV